MLKNFRLNKTKSIILFLLIAVIGITSFITLGQNPFSYENNQKGFSEEELEQFVDVAMKANEIQGRYYSEIHQVFEATGLNAERFNELLETGAENAPGEKAAFDNAYEKISAIQARLEEEVSAFINKEIGVDRYQEIVMAYQQDEEVQAAVEEILQRFNLQ